MSPSGRKASNILLRKSVGQVQVAPELMKWLGQSQKAADAPGSERKVRCCRERYGCAPLYHCPTLRQNRIMTTILWSQNDGLNRGFSLCDDGFPASGTDSSQNDDFQTADRWFQNGCRVNKMAPRCFLGRIPHCTGSENGRAMEDLHWTVSFKPLGTH